MVWRALIKRRVHGLPSLFSSADSICITENWCVFLCYNLMLSQGHLRLPRPTDFGQHNLKVVNPPSSSCSVTECSSLSALAAAAGLMIALRSVRSTLRTYRPTDRPCTIIIHNQGMRWFSAAVQHSWPTWYEALYSHWIVSHFCHMTFREHLPTWSIRGNRWRFTAKVSNYLKNNNRPKRTLSTYQLT